MTNCLAHFRVETARQVDDSVGFFDWMIDRTGESLFVADRAAVLELSILEQRDQCPLTAGAMVAGPIDGLVRSGGNVNVFEDDSFAVGTDCCLIRGGINCATSKEEWSCK